MRLSAILLLIATTSPLLAGSIPIVVKEGRAPAGLWPAPVKCGVPFPLGVLKADDPLLLVNDAGQPQALQSAVTAMWDPKGEKGVRWLLIDFAAERGRSYRLLFGADARAAVAPQLPPVGHVEGGRIVIDTGKLQAACGPARFDLLNSLRLRNRPAVASDLPAGPYIEHEKRGLFRGDLDKEARVLLEETGPLRATVKADGWYVNEAGEKFCRFSVRLHFFRGQSSIRVEHTFIFTGNSLEDRLRDIGFRIPLARTRHQHSYVMFGAQPDDGPMVPVEAGSSSDTHAYQVMDSPDHRRFEWFLRRGDDRNVSTGVKAAGVLRGNTDLVSLAAVLRDAWQQYPFEMEWNRGEAIVHFWPKHGRLWDTSWDGIWYFLTDQQKRFMTRSKPKVDDKNFDAILANLRRSNAYGAAKTHELWLLFDVDAHWISLPMYHDYVHHPPYAHADLAWQCASRALDWLPHQPYDRANFPNEEDFLDTALDIVQRHRDYVGYYGWWDWGAYHQFFNDGEPVYRSAEIHFENTGNEQSWHRAKPKSHYLWGSLPWTQYLRTGDARWLRYAQSYTLYALDRDTIHDGPGAGSEFPYDNSEVHWLGGWQGAPGGRIHIHNLLEKNDAIYQFWLTGDRRPMDVLKMWADQYDRAWSPKEVYYDPKQAFVGNNIRNTGGRLRRLVSYYEATWDERFRDHCTRLGQVFPGAAVGDLIGDATWFASWMHEGLFRYWKVFGDPRIRESALAYCRHQTDSGAGMLTGGLESGIMDWCAVGFELSGDELYLDLGRRILDRQVTPWASRDSCFHPGAQKFRLISMPRFMGVMANAPAGWRARNLPAHLNGTSVDYYFYDRHSSGDKMRSIHLLKETDRPFSVEFTVTHRGAQFALFGPDGKIVARQKPKPAPSARTVIEAPQDGRTGTYTLRCIAIDDKSLQPGEHPRLCLVRSDLDKVVYEAPARAPANTFSARAWHVGVPAGADGVRVLWRPDYGQFRAGLSFTISDTAGDWRLSSAGLAFQHFNGGDIYRYTLAIPPAGQPRVFRCGVDYRAHAVVAYPDGIGNAFTGGFAVVGAPPYIAAAPSAWFAPEPPTAYEKP